MRLKGWFKTPEQDGDRTLAEQLEGLGPMLEEARGRSVLDLGCAEGLIAKACADAGALQVLGVEMLPRYIEVARAQSGGGTVRFDQVDLNEWRQKDYGEHDIVLALAILHKLRDPERATRFAARAARRLLVVRLPAGSNGLIRWKHGKTRCCDLHAVLPEEGFFLDRDLEGPRGERVHHWRRA